MLNKKFLVIAGFAGALMIGGAARAESAGQFVDDATITTKVKAVILADSALKATDIGVKTDHGIVDLHGSVDTTSQASIAERDAAKVSGVRSVSNSLKIRTIAQ